MPRKKKTQIEYTQENIMDFAYNLLHACGKEDAFSLKSTLKGSGVSVEQARAWAATDEQYRELFMACIASLEENITFAGLEGKLKPRKVFELMLENDPDEEERLKRIWGGLDSQVDIAIATIESQKERARAGEKGILEQSE